MVRHGSPQKEYSANGRIAILLILLIIIAGAIVTRLFLIQVVRGVSYNLLARKQQQTLQELVPQRGEILVQDRYKSSSLAVVEGGGGQQAAGAGADPPATLHVAMRASRTYYKSVRDGERLDVTQSSF